MAVFDLESLCALVGVEYPPEFYDGPALTLGAAVRNAAGDEVSFTLAGLEDETDGVLGLWLTPDGSVGSSYSVGNGTYTFAGLNAYYAYTIVVVSMAHAGDNDGKVNQNIASFNSPAVCPDGGTIEDLCAAIAAELQAYGPLGYVEAVGAAAYRPDWVGLPAFETYGIVVSPEGYRVETQAMRLKQKICRVDIVLLVERAAEADSLTAINGMIEDVFNCLNNNDLGEYVELTGEELAGKDWPLNVVHSAERDKFYREVKINTTWWLQPFVED
jgi:hypothetical protein